MNGALTLRHAQTGDCDRLLEWRNDPATAAASRTGTVSPDRHGEWLAQVLADADRHLLIAERDREPFGQVRFDRIRAYRYEISVSVAAPARGEGLGIRLIEGAAEWLWVATNAGAIEAEVRVDNEASLRSFERAGFRRAGEGEGGLVALELRRPEPFAPERPVDRERLIPFSG